MRTVLTRRLLLLTVVSCAAFSLNAHAQQTTPVAPSAQAVPPAAVAADTNAPLIVAPVAPPMSSEGVVVTPTPLLVSTSTVIKRDSLFFTQAELIAIMRANQGSVAVHEAAATKIEDGKPVPPVDLGPRVVALTGLLYHGKDDWTIWLNDERVTPKAIPKRIKGLAVQAEYVRLRWEDTGTNRIVNMTLHPNQKYLLDSDTIVSGSQ